MNSIAPAYVGRFTYTQVDHLYAILRELNNYASGARVLCAGLTPDTSGEGDLHGAKAILQHVIDAAERTQRAIDELLPTCKAHYPALLDGEPVSCTLPEFHDGDHEEHVDGEVRSFEDQPECWV